MEYVIQKDEEIQNSPSLEAYLTQRRISQSSQDSGDMANWSDNCDYTCGICGEVTLSYLKFHLHIVRQHKMKNMKEYKKEYDEPKATHR